MQRNIKNVFKTLTAILCLLVAAGGVLIMTNGTKSRERTFKLRQLSEYFPDQKVQALVQSAMAGDRAKATWLVAEGADPNSEGPPDNPYNRLRLLHYAIAAKNQCAVEILEAVGADPELVAEGYGNAFDFTITLRNLNMLSYLLDLTPVSTLTPNTIDYLIFGSESSDCHECLDVVIQRGAPVDFLDSAGYTVMMRAIDSFDYELAEWLIRKGASVHIEAVGGMTPAYSVQFDLRRFKPDSPPYLKALHLKQLMEEHGAVFPALSPDEVLAKRAQKKT